VKLKDTVKSEAKPITSDKTTDEDAEQHIMMLSGNGFKLAPAFSNLRALFTCPRNPALMDGKEPMTELLFEQLTPVDSRILLGKYLLNFLNFSRPS
jgi:hypothetical protein